MGCDIHGVFQKYNSEIGAWEDIPSLYKQNRNYQLFSVLAGVRQSHIDPIDPISPPRGLPEDFEQVLIHGDFEHPVKSKKFLTPFMRLYGDDPDFPMRSVWMGDHSYSWLSGEEMLSWYSSSPKQLCSGVISQEQYLKWDLKSPPYPYSQGVFGDGIRVVDEEDVPDEILPWSHIRVTWEEDLCESLSFFFKEVERLCEEHGTIRFVFGLDS